jgi:hypothetical protein
VSILANWQIPAFVAIMREVDAAVTKAMDAGLTRDEAIGALLQVLVVLDARQPFGETPRELLKLLAEEGPDL